MQKDKALSLLPLPLPNEKKRKRNDKYEKYSAGQAMKFRLYPTMDVIALDSSVRTLMTGYTCSDKVIEVGTGDATGIYRLAHALDCLH